MGRPIRHPDPARDRERALANPRRRKVYDLLADRWLTAAEIAAALDINRNSVDTLLRYLVDAGLVAVTPGDPTGVIGRPVNRYRAIADGEQPPTPPAHPAELVPTGIYHIGTAIRGRRDTIGLSQQELGARAGIHQSDVSEVERGRMPSLVLLARIALALDLDVWELLRDAQDWAVTGAGEPE